MELKPGYRQTEVGVIPEEWEMKRLGELASVTAGGTPSRTNPRYWNGSIPWVTTSEVDFYTINHAEQFITKDGLNNSSAKLLPPGTLLMALYGQGKTRGKIGVLGIEATTNQACAAISLNRSVSRDFVFHFLASQYEAIRNLSNTGSQENLNGSIVRSISILLPPKAEQRAISRALGDVDALIASLDKLIAKKRDLKQAAMQQLLSGKQRLPGFENRNGSKQTDVGVIPADWISTTFGQVVDLLTGYPFQSKRYVETGIRLVRGSNVKRGVLDWSDDISQCWSCITPDISRYKLREGDLVIAMDGALVGKSYAVISNADLPCLLLQRVARVRSNSVDSRLLAFWVGSDSFVKHVDSLKTHSAIPHISPADIRGFAIAVPSDPEEQRAITTVLSDMDADIVALEQRRNKTRALKQGMMQELLTGRTRLV